MSTRWLPVSHDTLVQEGNYRRQSRHIWQGDTPKTAAHVIKRATSAERDQPHVGSWGNSPRGIRGDKTLTKRPRRLSKYNWGRLLTTAETAELHTPECCSMPHSSPLASAAGGSALLDGGLRLPCCPPGSGDPFLQDADKSFAHCAVSRTCRLRLWDSGSLSPIDCSVCVCVCVCVIIP